MPYTMIKVERVNRRNREYECFFPAFDAVCAKMSAAIRLTEKGNHTVQTPGKTDSAEMIKVFREVYDELSVQSRELGTYFL